MLPLLSPLPEGRVVLRQYLVHMVMPLQILDLLLMQQKIQVAYLLHLLVLEEWQHGQGDAVGLTLVPLGLICIFDKRIRPCQRRVTIIGIQHF